MWAGYPPNPLIGENSYISISIILIFLSKSVQKIQEIFKNIKFYITNFEKFLEFFTFWWGGGRSAPRNPLPIIACLYYIYSLSHNYKLFRIFAFLSRIFSISFQILINYNAWQITPNLSAFPIIKISFRPSKNGPPNIWRTSSPNRKIQHALLIYTYI